MALNQLVAVVMVNKCVKFEDNSFNSIEVTVRIQFFPIL